MIPAMILVAACQVDSEPGAIIRGLAYLARHQGEDGSWGRRPPGCRCPADPPPRAEVPLLDEAGRVRVAALLAKLDDEDPVVRDAAHAELLRIGRAAEPPLEAAAGGPEPRARAQAILRAFREAPRKDDVELTGWVLLAFLGAGYSHLSKDVHDGRTFGDTVRAGLRRLAETREVVPGSAAEAVRALALTEAYGLTGSVMLQEPAREAAAMLLWSTGREDRARFWQVLALGSARVSGLEVPRTAFDARLEVLAGRLEKEPSSVLVRSGLLFATPRSSKPEGVQGLGVLEGADPETLDAEAAYAAGLALVQRSGPPGRAFFEAAWRRLRRMQVQDPARCDRGAWAAPDEAARIESSSLALMLAECTPPRAIGR